MPNKEEKNITERPPIIVVMGHVDHGKSTLLDYIRKTNIVASEAGGITQHISAYEVAHKNKQGAEQKITFLDTPGHQAFSAMRSRGANVADMAILVVSAEDGVKTQTMEAYEAIKKADVPFVVAINKIDRPQANLNKAISDLIENGIYIEGYGGDIPYVPISAKTGEGVDKLLDIILLVSQMEELKGDNSKNAEGFVIETNVDPKKGISATLIITNGKIKNGMHIAVGESMAPVRIMEDFSGKKITEATFSSPIRITGFTKAPEIGLPFKTFESKKEAEQYAVEHKELICKENNSGIQNQNSYKTIVPVVIKADVLGSVEAIKNEISKLANEKICIRFVQTGVGSISENDVKNVGNDKNTLIIGFNVLVEDLANQIAEKFETKIKVFNIIYELTDWVKGEIERITPKIKTEEITGVAKIIRVFSKTRDKQIIGGRVDEGTLKIKESVKILRRDEEIGTGVIIELQQQRADIKEASVGTEFGAKIESKITIAQGDKIKSFNIVEI
ncbi:MAG: bacterial translation initiation factor 2 (bIF-2) [Parcubacteria group bacterium Athens0714_16]|nr:MAG: bacterial translation initiation factor 2 (bIF-2) [Parcubacteria group bacterium Athens0714_16]